MLPARDPLPCSCAVDILVTVPVLAMSDFTCEALQQHCKCRLKGHSLRGGARAVLLAPTRELALQTHKVVKELSRYTDLRTAVLVGGDSMEAQFAELAANPDIIVATPGALHHLSLLLL